MVELNIHWRFILNTSKPNKAKKIENNIISLIGSVHKTESEIYWKDKKKIELSILQKMIVEDESFFLFVFYKKLILISKNWNFSFTENLLNSFDGFTSDLINLQGCEWASFMIHD